MKARHDFASYASNGKIAEWVLAFAIANRWARSIKGMRLEPEGNCAHDIVLDCYSGIRHIDGKADYWFNGTGGRRATYNIPLEIISQCQEGISDDEARVRNLEALRGESGLPENKQGWGIKHPHIPMVFFCPQWLSASELAIRRSIVIECMAHAGVDTDIDYRHQPLEVSAKAVRGMWKLHDYLMDELDVPQYDIVWFKQKTEAAAWVLKNINKTVAKAVPNRGYTTTNELINIKYF